MFVRSEAVVGRGDDEALGLPGAQGRRPPLRLGRVADGHDLTHDNTRAKHARIRREAIPNMIRHRVPAGEHGEI